MISVVPMVGALTCLNLGVSSWSVLADPFRGVEEGQPGRAESWSQEARQPARRGSDLPLPSQGSCSLVSV